MPNFKLSDARTTHPPQLPILGTDLLFMTIFRSGNDLTAVVTADELLAGVKASIASLETAVAGKAPTIHTHTIAQVTNLQTTLDGKSNVGHTHNYVDKTGDVMSGKLEVSAVRIWGTTSALGTGQSVIDWYPGRFINYDIGRNAFGFGGAPVESLGFTSVGANSNISIMVRDDFAKFWTFYAQGGVLRLWNTAYGDRFHFYENGEFRPLNGIDTGSSPLVKHDHDALPYSLDEHLMKIKVTSGRYKPDFNADQRKRLFLDTENFRDLGITEPVRRAAIEYGGEMVDAMQYEQNIPLLVHFLQQAVERIQGLEQRVQELEQAR